MNYRCLFVIRTCAHVFLHLEIPAFQRPLNSNLQGSQRKSIDVRTTFRFENYDGQSLSLRILVVYREHTHFSSTSTLVEIE